MRIIFIASDEEAAEWKRQAAAVKMNLSVYIRARLNGLDWDAAKKLAGLPQPVTAQDVGDKESAVADKPASARTPQQKSCEHGVQRGYRCWQCGGLAKIG